MWIQQKPFASLTSLMASQVTTSRMQQCFNVLIDIYHELLLLFYWCILLEIKLTTTKIDNALRWRHNDHAGVSNHQPPGCLLNRLFRRKSKKTSKLRVTGLCAGNSPGTGEFSAQMASYAENVSIWWRHHGTDFYPNLDAIWGQKG